MAKAVVFRRDDGRWAWRLRADNDQIIAVDGNQGYENYEEARDMLDRIINGEFKDAERRWVKPSD